MNVRTVIWVDLQTSRAAGTLASEIEVLCTVLKLHEPAEIVAAARAFSPLAIIFEQQPNCWSHCKGRSLTCPSSR